MVEEKQEKQDDLEESGEHEGVVTMVNIFLCFSQKQNH